MNGFTCPGTHPFKAEENCLHGIVLEWGKSAFPNSDSIHTLLCPPQGRNTRWSGKRLGYRLWKSQRSNRKFVHHRMHCGDTILLSFSKLCEQNPFNLFHVQFTPTLFLMSQWLQKRNRSEYGSFYRENPATSTSNPLRQ